LTSKTVDDWEQDLPREAQQRREVFARFGLAVFQTQAVERQVGILLATMGSPGFLNSTPEDRGLFFETSFKKTLGRLVKDLGKAVDLPPHLETDLDRALELRNWLAHGYFWERAEEILHWDGCESMISELQEAADFLEALDAELTALGIAALRAMGGALADIEARLGELNV